MYQNDSCAALMTTGDRYLDNREREGGAAASCDDSTTNSGVRRAHGSTDPSKSRLLSGSMSRVMTVSLRNNSDTPIGCFRNANSPQVTASVHIRRTIREGFQY
jgi:hypothetical protein